MKNTLKISIFSWVKRHKILTVILGLFALSLLGIVAGGVSNMPVNTVQTSTASAPITDTTVKAPVAKVGQSVDDGSFEFTVTNVDCGKPTVGDSNFDLRTAKGQYCLISVSVKNIGDKPQTLFTNSQRLFDNSGQFYKPDDVATSYAVPNADVWNSTIDTGATVSGTLVFDIAKGQTPLLLTLHESSYSKGAKVNLQ